MADIPDGILLKRHRDFTGRGHELWVRRGLLTLVAAVLVLGLVNVFGQRPQSTTVSGSGATLKLYAPARVRGGLMYEARFRITAKRELKDAQLLLGSGWLEGMTINTIEPSPIGEGSRDGDLLLDLGHIPAGERYLLFVQTQVNPTNIGSREADVELYDGSKRIAHIDHTITVFP
jgi:hypothetical protein